MILNYDEFVLNGNKKYLNESVEGRSRIKISNIKEIDDVYSNFMKFTKFELNYCIEHISKMFKYIDEGIELVKKECSDIIVGEPIITFAKPSDKNDKGYTGINDMSAISFCFNTNIPFDVYMDDKYDMYEDKMDDLSEKLEKICDRFNYDEYSCEDFNIRAIILEEGDENGNIKFYVDIEGIKYTKELIDFIYSVNKDMSKQDAIDHIEEHLFDARTHYLMNKDDK